VLLLVILCTFYIAMDGFFMRKQVASENVNNYCGTTDNVSPLYTQWQNEVSLDYVQNFSA
jgi:hypothetical protein